MNLNSLAHSVAKNQQTSSWIDDPFDIKSEFNGMNNTNNNTNLLNYAQELVCHYGNYGGGQYSLSLDDLDNDEQNELARLYIEATGRELTECVNGNDFSIENDYTCALLSLLQNYCQETRDVFAAVTRKNIIIYYKDSLQNILDEACHVLLCNLSDEDGIYSGEDSETGESVWSRF